MKLTLSALIRFSLSMHLFYTTLHFSLGSNADGDDESNSSKRRRSRTNFNSWQLDELERAFLGEN